MATMKHKDDMIILVGMGNCLFSKQRVLPKRDKMHMEKPGYLNDQGALEFLEGMVGLLRRLSGRFAGTVYWAGPFPRHLADCCADPEHHFQKSSVFKGPLHYVDLWNRFLHVNPKIRVRDNVSFVPFFHLLGEKFYNKWLRDLVHFTTDINDNFAQALANLPRSPTPLPDPLPLGDLSFTTWSLLQPVTRPVSTSLSAPQSHGQPTMSGARAPASANLPLSPSNQPSSTTLGTTTTTTTTTTAASRAGTSASTAAQANTAAVIPSRRTTAASTTTTNTVSATRPIPSIQLNGQNLNRPVGVVSSALSTMTTAERDQILTDAGLMETE